MNTENTHASFEPDWYATELGTHKGKNVIWVKFEKNQDKIKQLRTTTVAYWSASAQMWYVADTNFNRKLFNLETNIIGKEVLHKINNVNLKAMQNFQEMIVLKGYSKNTLRTYSIEFAQLLYIIKDFPAEKLSSEYLRSYILYCHTQLRLSENQIHSRINAIKFYFEQVLHQPRVVFALPRPKKKLLLPKALNKSEIKKLFDVTQNIKHKLILKLAYGMGLRVSEIVNIKIEHIDSENMQIHIVCAKGKKDRYVNLPESVLEELRAYYVAYLPKLYLFEGEYGGQYSVRSAQAVFKAAMRKAKISKTIGIHSLRHSFATHLLQQGTDIRHIKDLMGHNNIKTTSIYTQVTDSDIKAIQSPLDNL